MNKRPHPGGLGLPAKPYTPPQAGPAPPLPAGQPPQQQQQYGGDQAAHAAAWAAYYQSQGAAAGQAAGYGGGGGGAAPADSSASNPYANYGYGAGATHAQGYSGGQQGGQASPPQSYNQQQGYNNQQGGYNQNYQQGGYGQGPGYNQSAGYNQQQGQQGQQGYGGWGANYGPQQPQQQSPNPTAGGYTPQNSNQYYGQQGGGQPGFRPPQNRPYQPQPGGPGGPGPRGSPARPPPGGPGPSGPGGPGGPGGFPPAKRPRFDGPGGPGGGMPPRPPNPRPPPGYGSGHARPMNERGGGSGRGGAPPNVPIPRIGFGGPPQRPQRGGMRGGGPMGRGGGMMGRGPPMRQRDQREMRPPRTNQRVEASPQQARKRKDKDTKEARTTMTDFRIVGIEVKGLDWSWGLVGEHVVDDKDDDKEKDIKAQPDAGETKPESESEAKPVDDKSEEPAVKTEDPTEVKPEAEAEAKPEGDAAAETEDAHDASDEKRGEKRKAKPSSVDGDDAQSPKKRTFILTHNKVNTPGEGPSPESNQNRFRIYFESPPELDRVPKAARRNPNKRWRRESTALTETLHEETHEEPQAHDEAAVKAETEVVKNDALEATDAPKEEPSSETAPEANGDKANGEKAEETSAEVKTEPAAETAEAAETKPTEPAEPAAEPAPEVPADEMPAETEVKEEAGDVSMVTDPGTVEGAEHEHEDHSGLTGAEASAAELETALAESAQNAASAYGSRQKPRGRRWSTSSIGSDNGSDAGTIAGDGVTQPSVNRVSVLYEDSTRRLVFDASVVQKIRIFRGEGRIEVDLLPQPKEALAAEGEGEETKEVTEETELPKGVLVETKDAAENRFVAVSREKLGALWKDEADKSLPPLHRIFGPTSEPVTLTVFLNKKKPLSEPKWCRTNQADEWLYEQFGRRAASDAGWRGKLEIMDPDAPPTLSNILETWKGGSNTGTAEQRADFTSSLLATPNDLLEILLRLTRGERNPTASIGTGPTSANGPLATAIRPDSPYASHQTHVSLAILAMYRLTTDYASQAGVKTEVLNDQIAEIIRSLPSHMIHKSLDGLYKEWLAERRA